MLQEPSAPQNIKSIWLSILQFLHRCSLSRLTPKLLTATRNSFAVEESISERCDPLVLWYAEIDSVEQFKARKDVDFVRLIETNIRVSIGSAHDQRDVAISTLDLAREEAGLQPESDWLVALGKWDEALFATKRELENGERDLFAVVTNQVRQSSSFRKLYQLNFVLSQQIISHFNRMDYAEVYSLANRHYDSFSMEQKESIAHWNATASWAVGDFLNMSHYLTHMKKGSSKLLYK